MFGIRKVISEWIKSYVDGYEIGRGELYQKILDIQNSLNFIQSRPYPVIITIRGIAPVRTGESHARPIQLGRVIYLRPGQTVEQTFNPESIMLRIIVECYGAIIQGVKVGNEIQCHAGELATNRVECQSSAHIGNTIRVRLFLPSSVTEL